MLRYYENSVVQTNVGLNLKLISGKVRQELNYKLNLEAF